MLKSICALLLLLAATQSLGPLTPGVVRCADEQEQGCQSPDCANQCSLCTCPLDRPMPPVVDLSGVHLVNPTGKHRLVPLQFPASPPPAEILHVPEIAA